MISSRIKTTLYASLLLAGLASTASAIGFTLNDDYSYDRVSIYHNGSTYSDNFIYGDNPAWIDPRSESHTDGWASFSSDLDVNNYGSGVTINKTTNNITQDGTTAWTRLFTRVHILFTLTESVSYAISGGFSGTNETVSTYNEVGQYVSLSGTGGVSVYEDDRDRVYAGESGPFSLAFGDGSALGGSGSLTGVLGPGSYTYYAIQRIEGYGQGSGSGFATLQLGEAPASTVPTSIPGLGIMSALLAGLAACNRRRTR